MAFSLLLALGLGLGSANADLRWIDAHALHVEGQAWTDVDSPFDRLPKSAQSQVRPAVWNLARHSAGISVSFVTDSPTVEVRWSLTSDQLDMPHMPATGVSGVDLYVRTDTGWRWLANGRPGGRDNHARLASNLPPTRRELRVYLPTYNGVTSLSIGVGQDASCEPSPPRPPNHAKPIVFYGTSITQGACASRPGSNHVALLGRRLDRPVVNLGFSGNGKLESEFVELLSQIDASVYVLDCLPNLQPSEVAQRALPFVHALRKAKPTTPILLVEDRTYSNAFLHAGLRARNEGNRKALRSAYEQLVADGVTNLAYLEGDGLLGDDGEGTVDGSHPTDLGFVRQANAFEAELRPLLKEN